MRKSPTFITNPLYRVRIRMSKFAVFKSHFDPFQWGFGNLTDAIGQELNVWFYFNLQLYIKWDFIMIHFWFHRQLCLTETHFIEYNCGILQNYTSDLIVGYVKPTNIMLSEITKIPQINIKKCVRSGILRSHKYISYGSRPNAKTHIGI